MQLMVATAAHATSTFLNTDIVYIVTKTTNFTNMY